MKKLIFYFIFHFLFLFFVSGQTQTKFDKIIFKDKTSLECKILKVTESTIEVDPIGDKPFLIVERNNVSYIIYSDNTVVNFQNVDIISDKNSSYKNNISSSQNNSWKDCESGCKFRISIPMQTNYEYSKGVTIPTKLGTSGRYFGYGTDTIKACNDTIGLLVMYSMSLEFDEKFAIVPWAGRYYVKNIKLSLFVISGSTTVYKKEVFQPEQVVLTEGKGKKLNFGSFDYEGQMLNITINLTKVYRLGYEQFSTFFTLALRVSTSGWRHSSDNLD